MSNKIFFEIGTKKYFPPKKIIHQNFFYGPWDFHELFSIEKSKKIKLKNSTITYKCVDFFYKKITTI